MAEKTDAANLPDYSVVADKTTAFIKSHPTITAQWRGTNGGYFGDAYINQRITLGAQVLRVGAGER
jgi:hypothetical protein